MSTYHFNHFKFWVRQVELLQVHRQDWVDPSDLTSVHSIIYFWRQCWSATKRKNNSQFKLALQLIRSTLRRTVQWFHKHCRTARVSASTRNEIIHVTDTELYFVGCDVKRCVFYSAYEYSDILTRTGRRVEMCWATTEKDFILHTFTTNENIAKSLRGRLLFFDSHCMCGLHKQLDEWLTGAVDLVQ